MSVIKNTTGLVVRNRAVIGRTVLYFAAITAADAAIKTLVAKNS
jgi:hypothetical protein